MGRNRDTKRPPRATGQLSADDGVGTTIVGGQPPGRSRRQVRGIPVGVERVLYAAATDSAFREALRQDREAAIRAGGFRLRASEMAMLRLIPDAQLQATIDGLDLGPESLERRTFLQAVAASAVTIAAGEAVGGCSDDTAPPAGDGGADVTTDGIPPDTAPDTLPPDTLPPDTVPPDTVWFPSGPDMGIRPETPDLNPAWLDLLSSWGSRPKD